MHRFNFQTWTPCLALIEGLCIEVTFKGLDNDLLTTVITQVLATVYELLLRGDALFLSK